jgi:hypothetical protein
MLKLTHIVPGYRYLPEGDVKTDREWRVDPLKVASVSDGPDFNGSVLFSEHGLAIAHVKESVEEVARMVDEANNKRRTSIHPLAHVIEDEPKADRKLPPIPKTFM